jgi:hypothetical protein
MNDTVGSVDLGTYPDTIETYLKGPYPGVPWLDAMYKYRKALGRKLTLKDCVIVLL